MKTKSETDLLLFTFVMYVKNQFNKNIKTFTSKTGRELFCYDKFGFLHKKACVETPQNNVVVKRKHKYISMMLPVIFIFNLVYQRFIDLILLLMLFI